MRKEFWFLLSALLIYICTALNSLGYYHADEHFQLLEFASYKAGNPNTQLDNLAWEFKAHIRPAAQVFIAFCSMKAFYAFDIKNPFAIASFLRILSALLSLFCFGLLYKAFRNEYQAPFSNNALLLLICGLWFIPFFAVRFSSETWSGALFFIAAAWLVLVPSDKKWLTRLGIGFLLGLSFIVRYQSGFLIFGLLLWLFIMRKEYGKAGFYLLPAGIVAAFTLGIVLDHWLYSTWVFTAWEYLKVNILQGKANEFGTSPWYQYFPYILEKANPFIGLLVIASMLWLWIKRPKSMLTWISLPFVLIHFAIAHKELRFLNPLIFMLPLAVGYIMEDLWGKFAYKKVMATLFLALNIPFLLYVMYMPASMEIKAFEEAYPSAKAGNATIYYTSTRPFPCIYPTFYLPEAPHRLILKHVDNATELRSADFRNAILFSSRLGLDDSSKTSALKIELLNQRLPRFLTTYGNFFGWVDRTTIDCVYSCSKDGKVEVADGL